MAHAWDAKLEAAAKRVAAGGTDPTDLKLVRQNNDVINRMAKQHVIDNTTYQKVQEDFSTFNDA